MAIKNNDDFVVTRIFFFSLLCCICPIIEPFCWSNKTRFSAGPTWHKFFSYEAFIAPLPTNPFDEILTPVAEIINANYDTMPYIEAKNRLYINDSYNATIMLGGGKLTKGNGQVSYINKLLDFYLNRVPFQYTRECSLNASILLFDIGFGYELPYKNGVSLNPLIGYIHNNESVYLSVFKNPIHYCLFNVWQGPFIGIEMPIKLSTSSTLRVQYKAILGNVHSRLLYTSTPELDTQPFVNVIIPDPSLSCWRTSMFGNLFNAEFNYNFYHRYSIGTSVQYFRFNNHKNSCVKTYPKSTLFTAAHINKLDWQQVFWTFFIELLF